MSIEEVLTKKLATARGKKMFIDDMLNSTFMFSTPKMNKGQLFHLGNFKSALYNYRVYGLINEVVINEKIIYIHMRYNQVNFPVKVRFMIEVHDSTDKLIGTYELRNVELSVNSLPRSLYGMIMEHISSCSAVYEKNGYNPTMAEGFFCTVQQYSEWDFKEILKCYQYCTAEDYLSSQSMNSNAYFCGMHLKVFRDKSSVHSEIEELTASDSYGDWIFNCTLNGCSESDLADVILDINYMLQFKNTEVTSTGLHSVFIELGNKGN